MIIISIPDSNRCRWVLRLGLWPIFSVIGQWDNTLRVFVPVPEARLTQKDIEGLARELQRKIG